MNRDLALQILTDLISRAPVNRSEAYAGQSALSFLDDATKPVEPTKPEEVTPDLEPRRRSGKNN
jgi:hypothetical protein